MNQRGVSGIRNMHSKNGTGMVAPSIANIDQSRYLPAMKHIKIPVKNQPLLINFLFMILLKIIIINYNILQNKNIIFLIF